MEEKPAIFSRLIHVLKWWFTPRSKDPTVSYRERALRVLLPTHILLRSLAIANAYSTTDVPPRLIAEWFAFLILFALSFFSFYYLAQKRINLSGLCFLLNWYLIDMTSGLPADGYWNPGFQISIILQAVLGTLLLPGRAILPYMIFQLTTIGLWGGWLDAHYFNPPLLATGKPITIFSRAIATLAIQEAIIVVIVRYLRLEMEKSLRLQQTTIGQLQKEIKERSRIEVEREAIIEELNKKNAELERFTYTVSHDLKSPLVTIKGFLGMLKKDLMESRQDRVQKDFERISEAAEKMGTLLSELLELSRIGRIINPPTKINLHDLAQEVIDTLGTQIQSRNIKIYLSPDLPVVYGDRIRLREVYENLIDNAIKYIGEQPAPLIEIGVQKENETILFMKDNGMGIDSKYHTRIFGLFEKLDSASEGTGVGLALVKRIIETHGPHGH